MSGVRREHVLPLVGGASVALASCAVIAWPIGLFVAAAAGPLAAHGVVLLAQRSVAVLPDADLALGLDLAAAALRCGQPLANALQLAAPAAGAAEDRFRQVAVLLRLGAEPAEAWAEAASGPLAPVARAAVRSADSGVRLAGVFETLARDLRRDLVAAAQHRAQRVGVAALAPLGLCFLPAFVCLGIVPVVVGIARTAVIGVP